MPLWLLDVDGVLNAVALYPSERVWPRWRQGVAHTDEGTHAWPITWSPDVIERLTGWLADGAVEIQWLTTWGDDANDELATLLGLPPLPVAGSAPWRAAAGGPAASHAEVAGADAVDPLSGHWWKFDVVRRICRAEPRRPLVWTDDDLAEEPAVVAWMRRHSTCVLIAPHPQLGLGPADLDAIGAFLAAHVAPA